VSQASDVVVSTGWWWKKNEMINGLIDPHKEKSSVEASSNHQA
jgi:hypothetical protein